jgi:3'-phosphoadenosine 5'-phosphosulfate sulfotransferase (PAPS reductase)/FAD synthetase
MLTVLSLGGGVQSTALALLAATRDPILSTVRIKFDPEMEGEPLPMPALALFADTHRERQTTYAHLWRLAEFCEARGLPVHVCSEGDLGEETFTRSGPRIPAFVDNDGTPGIVSRACTDRYKKVPMQRYIKRRVLGMKSGARWPRVAKWIGISTDEVQRLNPGAVGHWERRLYPLAELGWSRATCLEYLRSHGFDATPKSACVFCPYKSDHEWLRLKEDGGADWHYAVDFDRRLRIDHEALGLRLPPYLHRSLRPLDEVDLGEDQLDLFVNDCSGICGV